MMYNNLLLAIGNTPLINAEGFSLKNGLQAQILAKCEKFNPGGSIKDRAALAMIRDAEDQGLLKSGSVVIEPTSGNTGIGLALVCAQLGYPLILTMPESMSMERRSLLASLGAELILTPAKYGMQGAMDQAMLLAGKYDSAFIPNQFKNPANAFAHYYGTAQEIWDETAGQVDILVAGVGSGGTITGCGKRLKELRPEIEVVAVEPKESPLLSAGVSGPHGIQGIGANFVPALLDSSLIDQIITVSTEDALHYARDFAQTEGTGVGISSGAALCAAVELAKDEKNYNKRIVVILPDGSERYMSTALFNI